MALDDRAPMSWPRKYGGRSSMVEHLVVVQVVGGSSPLAHPIVARSIVNDLISARP